MRLLDTLNRILFYFSLYIKRSRVTEQEFSVEYTFIIIKYNRKKLDERISNIS